MAKRQPSQSNDMAAPAQPKARGGRGRKELGPEAIADIPASAPAARPADQEPYSDPQPLGTTSMSMASEPSEEDIRLRAYERYIARGRGDGADFDDWIEAERELRKQV